MAKKTDKPAPETETDAPEPAPVTTSTDGHDLFRRLKAATTADAALIGEADGYVALFEQSNPGQRLTASVSRELKRVRGLKG